MAVVDRDLPCPAAAAPSLPPLCISDTPEEERVFVVLCNYLSLGQHELAAAMLRQLVQLNYGRGLGLLRSLICFGPPPTWVCSASVPSSAHLCWLCLLHWKQTVGGRLKKAEESKQGVHHQGDVRKPCSDHTCRSTDVTSTFEIPEIDGLVENRVQFDLLIAQLLLDGSANNSPVLTVDVATELRVCHATMGAIQQRFTHESGESGLVGTSKVSPGTTAVPRFVPVGMARAGSPHSVITGVASIVGTSSTGAVATSSAWGRLTEIIYLPPVSLLPVPRILPSCLCRLPAQVVNVKDQLNKYTKGLPILSTSAIRQLSDVLDTQPLLGRSLLTNLVNQSSLQSCYNPLRLSIPSVPISPVVERPKPQPSNSHPSQQSRSRIGVSLVPPSGVACSSSARSEVLPTYGHELLAENCWDRCQAMHARVTEWGWLGQWGVEQTGAWAVHMLAHRLQLIYAALISKSLLRLADDRLHCPAHYLRIEQPCTDQDRTIPVSQGSHTQLGTTGSPVQQDPTVDAKTSTGFDCGAEAANNSSTSVVSRRSGLKSNQFLSYIDVTVGILGLVMGSLPFYKFATDVPRSETHQRFSGNHQYAEHLLAAGPQEAATPLERAEILQQRELIARNEVFQSALYNSVGALRKQSSPFVHEGQGTAQRTIESAVVQICLTQAASVALFVISPGTSISADRYIYADLPLPFSARSPKGAKAIDAITAGETLSGSGGGTRPHDQVQQSSVGEAVKCGDEEGPFLMVELMSVLVALHDDYGLSLDILSALRGKLTAIEAAATASALGKDRPVRLWSISRMFAEVSELDEQSEGEKTSLGATGKFRLTNVIELDIMQALRELDDTFGLVKGLYTSNRRRSQAAPFVLGGPTTRFCPSKSKPSVELNETARLMFRNVDNAGSVPRTGRLDERKGLCIYGSTAALTSGREGLGPNRQASAGFYLAHAMQRGQCSWRERRSAQRERKAVNSATIGHRHQVGRIGSSLLSRLPVYEAFLSHNDDFTALRLYCKMDDYWWVLKSRQNLLPTAFDSPFSETSVYDTEYAALKSAESEVEANVQQREEERGDETEEAEEIGGVASMHFWDAYFRFIRVTNNHCITYVTETALELIYSGEFEVAFQLLRKFPQLQSLVVTLAWPRFTSDICSRQLLVDELWCRRTLHLGDIVVEQHVEVLHYRLCAAWAVAQLIIQFGDRESSTVDTSQAITDPTALERKESTPASSKTLNDIATTLYSEIERQSLLCVMHHRTRLNLIADPTKVYAQLPRLRPRRPRAEHEFDEQLAHVYCTLKEAIRLVNRCQKGPLPSYMLQPCIRRIEFHLSSVSRLGFKIPLLLQLCSLCFSQQAASFAVPPHVVISLLLLIRLHQLDLGGDQDSELIQGILKALAAFLKESLWRAELCLVDVYGREALYAISNPRETSISSPSRTASHSFPILTRVGSGEVRAGPSNASPGQHIGRTDAFWWRLLQRVGVELPSASPEQLVRLYSKPFQTDIVVENDETVQDGLYDYCGWLAQASLCRFNTPTTDPPSLEPTTFLRRLLTDSDSLVVRALKLNCHTVARALARHYSRSLSVGMHQVVETARAFAVARDRLVGDTRCRSTAEKGRVFERQMSTHGGSRQPFVSTIIDEIRRTFTVANGGGLEVAYALVDLSVSAEGPTAASAEFLREAARALCDTVVGACAGAKHTNPVVLEGLRGLLKNHLDRLTVLLEAKGSTASASRSPASTDNVSQRSEPLHIKGEAEHLDEAENEAESGKTGETLQGDEGPENNTFVEPVLHGNERGGGLASGRRTLASVLLDVESLPTEPALLKTHLARLQSQRNAIVSLIESMQRYQQRATTTLSHKSLVHFLSDAVKTLGYDTEGGREEDRGKREVSLPDSVGARPATDVVGRSEDWQRDGGHPERGVERRRLGEDTGLDESSIGASGDSETGPLVEDRSNKYLLSFLDYLSRIGELVQSASEKHAQVQEHADREDADCDEGSHEAFDLFAILEELPEATMSRLLFEMRGNQEATQLSELMNVDLVRVILDATQPLHHLLLPSIFYARAVGDSDASLATAGVSSARSSSFLLAPVHPHVNGSGLKYPLDTDTIAYLRRLERPLPGWSGSAVASLACLERASWHWPNEQVFQIAKEGHAGTCLERWIIDRERAWAIAHYVMRGCCALNKGFDIEAVATLPLQHKRLLQSVCDDAEPVVQSCARELAEVLMGDGKPQLALHVCDREVAGQENLTKQILQRILTADDSGVSPDKDFQNGSDPIKLTDSEQTEEPPSAFLSMTADMPLSVPECLCRYADPKLATTIALDRYRSWDAQTVLQTMRGCVARLAQENKSADVDDLITASKNLIKRMKTFLTILSHPSAKWQVWQDLDSQCMGGGVRQAITALINDRQHDMARDLIEMYHFEDPEVIAAVEVSYLHHLFTAANDKTLAAKTLLALPSCPEYALQLLDALESIPNKLLLCKLIQTHLSHALGAAQLETVDITTASLRLMLHMGEHVEPHQAALLRNPTLLVETMLMNERADLLKPFLREFSQFSDDSMVLQYIRKALRLPVERGRQPSAFAPKDTAVHSERGFVQEASKSQEERHGDARLPPTTARGSSASPISHAIFCTSDAVATNSSPVPSLVIPTAGLVGRWCLTGNPEVDEQIRAAHYYPVAPSLKLSITLVDLCDPKNEQVAETCIDICDELLRMVLRLLPRHAVSSTTPSNQYVHKFQPFSTIHCAQSPHKQLWDHCLKYRKEDGELRGLLVLQPVVPESLLPTNDVRVVRGPEAEQRDRCVTSQHEATEAAVHDLDHLAAVRMQEDVGKRTSIKSSFGAFMTLVQEFAKALSVRFGGITNFREKIQLVSVLIPFFLRLCMTCGPIRVPSVRCILDPKQAATLRDSLIKDDQLCLAQDLCNRYNRLPSQSLSTAPFSASASFELASSPLSPTEPAVMFSAEERLKSYPIYEVLSVSLMHLKQYESARTALSSALIRTPPDIASSPSPLHAVETMEGWPATAMPTEDCSGSAERKSVPRVRRGMLGSAVFYDEKWVSDKTGQPLVTGNWRTTLSKMISTQERDSRPTHDLPDDGSSTSTFLHKNEISARQQAASLSAKTLAAVHGALYQPPIFTNEELADCHGFLAMIIHDRRLFGLPARSPLLHIGQAVASVRKADGAFTFLPSPVRKKRQQHSRNGLLLGGQGVGLLYPSVHPARLPAACSATLPPLNHPESATDRWAPEHFLVNVSLMPSYGSRDLQGRQPRAPRSSKSLPYVSLETDAVRTNIGGCVSDGPTMPSPPVIAKTAEWRVCVFREELAYRKSFADPQSELRFVVSQGKYAQAVQSVVDQNISTKAFVELVAAPALAHNKMFDLQRILCRSTKRTREPKISKYLSAVKTWLRSRRALDFLYSYQVFTRDYINAGVVSVQLAMCTKCWDSRVGHLRNAVAHLSTVLQMLRRLRTRAGGQPGVGLSTPGVSAASPKSFGKAGNEPGIGIPLLLRCPSSNATILTGVADVGASQQTPTKTLLGLMSDPSSSLTAAVVYVPPATLSAQCRLFELGEAGDIYASEITESDIVRALRSLRLQIEVCENAPALPPHFNLLQPSQSVRGELVNKLLIAGLYDLANRIIDFFCLPRMELFIRASNIIATRAATIDEVEQFLKAVSGKLLREDVDAVVSNVINAWVIGHKQEAAMFEQANRIVGYLSNPRGIVDAYLVLGQPTLAFQLALRIRMSGPELSCIRNIAVERGENTLVARIDAYMRETTCSRRC